MRGQDHLLERLLRVRPETLVLMITAYGTVENAVAAFRRGAHDYLMKPVIFEELLAKLDRLMATRRLLLENQALRRALHAPIDPEERARVAVPLGRAGQAAEIAAGVLYLASDASRYVTGTELVIDGGMFAGGGARRV